MSELPEGPVSLVVDTDTGSDDAVALLLAARTSGVRLEAVTTVAGNVPVERGTRNALCTLELAGAGDVPVHVGCERPLIRPAVTAQHVHGEDGMGGVELPDPAGAPSGEHAVDALLRLSRESAGRSTLVTLGPLTNVAAALVRDRDLLTRFRHSYCMAGAADAVGNISATAEFNVWADPEATAVVLDAATPELVTFVGWDVSRRDAVMTPADQDALLALGSPLADFAHRINRTVDVWAREVTGLEGYDLPDPVTMAVALDPGLVRAAAPATVAVALGDEARGQLLIDHRHVAAPPNVTVVARVDGARFRRMLHTACLEAAT